MNRSASDIVVARVRKNATEDIVVEVRTFGGHLVVDVRTFVDDVATRKGLAFRADKLRPVITALIEAYRIANNLPRSLDNSERRPQESLH